MHCSILCIQRTYNGPRQPTSIRLHRPWRAVHYSHCRRDSVNVVYVTGGSASPEMRRAHAYLDVLYSRATQFFIKQYKDNKINNVSLRYNCHMSIVGLCYFINFFLLNLTLFSTLILKRMIRNYSSDTMRIILCCFVIPRNSSENIHE